MHVYDSGHPHVYGVQCVALFTLLGGLCLQALCTQEKKKKEQGR